MNPDRIAEIRARLADLRQQLGVERFEPGTFVGQPCGATWSVGDMELLLAALDEVTRERDEARADAAMVREALARNLSNAEIRALTVGEGKMSVTLRTELVSVIGEALAGMFDDSGAVNYVEMRVRSGEREFVLTIQLAGAKTPHECRREAERERDEARAMLTARCTCPGSRGDLLLGEGQGERRCLTCGRVR